MAENELNALEITGEITPADIMPESTVAPEPEPEIKPDEGGETPVDDTPDAATLNADIEKLKAQRKKAEEDARYWRKQKAEARADYFKRDREPEQPKPQPGEAAKPKPNDFNDYNEYVEALTDWKVENRRQEWDRQAAEKESNQTHQAKMAGLQEKINVGFEKYDDFEDVAMDQSVPITPAVMEILAEIENPADVAYYLGKNRTEAIAISRMTPIAAAREIAKIEFNLNINNPAPKPKEPNKTPKAPPPIKPVGSASAGEKDPEKMTPAEFAEWRRSQGAKPY